MQIPFLRVLPLAALGSDLTLWYDRPASNAMERALPVGEGRLGGVLFGGVENERFQFNEISLWTGDDHSEFGTASYGEYQTVGNLLLSFDGAERPLVTCPSGQQGSPGQARDGVRHQREVFTSHPPGLVVLLGRQTGPARSRGPSRCAARTARKRPATGRPWLSGADSATARNTKPWPRCSHAASRRRPTATGSCSKVATRR